MSRQKLLLIIDENDGIHGRLPDVPEGWTFRITPWMQMAELFQSVDVRQIDAIVAVEPVEEARGFEFIGKLRKSLRSSAPLLWISSDQRVERKVQVLKEGADDYLSVPYAMPELHARLVALLRRSKGQVLQERLQVGTLEIDVQAHQVLMGGRPLALNPTSWRLILCLARAFPEPVSRKALMSSLNCKAELSQKSFSSHIYNLRKAMGGASSDPTLLTVPGVGFKLVADRALNFQANFPRRLAALPKLQRSGVIRTAESYCRQAQAKQALR
ncbi:response regulator transcription factor [Pseudoxanthomonas sp. GM95]|uniref:winged helix-turn-helix domain-containing protein n=1 Tax=Pseudoxanthomonas sp. GM95 TaxID=1881043 RepID=UPI001587950C|nr:response regulator transcription factor [Pseudoxanthomonas sp. GM95]